MRSSLKLELYLFACKKDLVRSTKTLHLASILSKHTQSCTCRQLTIFPFSQYSNTSDLLLWNVVSLYSVWYHQKRWGSIFYECHVVKDSCQKFCKLLSWSWSAMKAIIKFRKIQYDKRPSQASYCEIPTVITQGDRYWCTPNIPTIRNAIWMKLAMIGAHMKPRKSKTCRSTTTSYKRIKNSKQIISWRWLAISVYY